MCWINGDFLCTKTRFWTVNGPRLGLYYTEDDWMQEEEVPIMWNEFKTVHSKLLLSIHSFSLPFILHRVIGKMQFIPGDLRQGTSWTKCQYITHIFIHIVGNAPDFGLEVVPRGKNMKMRCKYPRSMNQGQQSKQQWSMHWGDTILVTTVEVVMTSLTHSHLFLEPSHRTRSHYKYQRMPDG